MTSTICSKYFKFNDILASLLIPQLKDINKKLKKANDINNFYRKI